MEIKIVGEKISNDEVEAYKNYIREKIGENAFKSVKEITIKVDGDFVDLEWRFYDIPFDRIRRITGYLVGTLDRFNDGKRAEVEDRVNHDV